MRWTLMASGAGCGMQGGRRIEPNPVSVSRPRAKGERRWMRTVKPCGPDRGRSSLAEAAGGPTGTLSSSIREAMEAKGTRLQGERA